MRTIFKSPELKELGANTLGEGVWGTCETQWAAVQHSDLGTAVRGVVDDLEAPHLLPSGILEKMQHGLGPACFGLRTLLGHLDNRK